MKQALSVLLLATLLSGCSTVGNVFKKTGQILMDPSIQVGSADDQPTQIALSLYADLDVNPNAESLPVQLSVAEEDSTQSDSEADGPFAIRLNSTSRSGLIESLRALLGHLEEDRDVSGAAPDTLAVDPAPVPLPTVAQALQLPPEWQDVDASAVFVPLPVAATNATQPSSGLAPGQYGLGKSLPDAPAKDIERSVAATPIAFKILQLTDDSLLLNASSDQLQQDMKKALGSTYLRADDYVLVPGQYKFVNFRAIDEEANFIAVVADFRDPNGSTWSALFKLEPKGRKYALLIALQGTRVSIIDESYRPAHTSQTSKHP
ncbi:type VI secretion system lipoprotein TssJ [Pseudomonas aeruginosa]|nr:type VI secretion system lipoprotein TssJ [Pseudomonas aeruginosa]